MAMRCENGTHPPSDMISGEPTYKGGMAEALALEDPVGIVCRQSGHIEHFGTASAWLATSPSCGRRKAGVGD